MSKQPAEQEESFTVASIAAFHAEAKAALARNPGYRGVSTGRMPRALAIIAHQACEIDRLQAENASLRKRWDSVAELNRRRRELLDEMTEAKQARNPDALW